MFDYKQHIIRPDETLSKALEALDKLLFDKILFVVNHSGKLLGSITDGDIRRGLLKNKSLDTTLHNIYESSPKFLRSNLITPEILIQMREEGFNVLPIVDNEMRIIDIFSSNFYKSYLPIDAVIMAGGRGIRLAPLTDSIPKPLLKIGDKPIIQYNVDRLISFGVKDFWISVNYLKDQIKHHFNKNEKHIKISFIEEEQPMGTIGALSKVDNFENSHILVANSDLLTNLDYENFYLDFINKDADISMVTIPYEVAIPYGIIEHKNNNVKRLVEKPNYTYYSNAGIYLIKREILHEIPRDQFFNATDLIEKMIKNKRKVISYPFSGYWLDIGKPDDFKKANLELNSIKF